MRGRQWRAEQSALDLAVEHRAEGAGRRLEQCQGDFRVERVRRDPVEHLSGVQIVEVRAEDPFRRTGDQCRD